MSERYNIGELYIVIIGMVTSEQDGFIIREKNRKIIIAKQKNHTIFERGTYFQDILTDIKYDYFHDKFYDKSNYVNRYMSYVAHPLSMSYNGNKTKLKRKDVIKIVEKLNLEFNNTSKASEFKIQDNIIKMIVELLNKAKLVIDEDKRSDFISRLEELSKYYYENILMLKREVVDKLILNDPKHNLISECISQIVEIELEINMELGNNSIVEDYNKFNAFLRRLKNDRK